MYGFSEKTVKLLSQKLCDELHTFDQPILEWKELLYRGIPIKAQTKKIFTFNKYKIEGTKFKNIKIIDTYETDLTIDNGRLIYHLPIRSQKINATFNKKIIDLTIYTNGKIEIETNNELSIQFINELILHFVI